jgi:hypothetical protein
MTPLERLQRLHGLAAKATPRPWYFDEEGCCYGDLDHFHGDTTNPSVIEPVTGNRVDIEQADANYIAAAANLLPALVDVAESCLAWVEDMGTCHLCGFGSLPAYANARQPIEDQRQTEHDEDCPVLLFERALESEHG